MQSLPLVSVQIITYNQQNYVGEAIESTLKQDYPNLEIIVLDDCSDDNTALVVKKYLSDNRIKYYRNEKNIGRVKNYRKALYEHCKGEWVVNLDGDDYFTNSQYLTGAIRKILDCGGAEKVMFYQATIKSKNETNKIEYHFSHRIINNGWSLFPGKEYFLRCYENKFFSHLSTVYNRSKATKIGFYEHDILNSDLESMLKLALHGSVILENNVVGVWRIHENNASANFITEKNKDIKTIQRISNYARPFIGEKTASNWVRKAKKAITNLYREELASKGYLRRLIISFIKEGSMTKRSFILAPKAIVSWFKKTYKAHD